MYVCVCMNELERETDSETGKITPFDLNFKVHIYLRNSFRHKS